MGTTLTSDGETGRGPSDAGGAATLEVFGKAVFVPGAAPGGVCAAASVFSKAGASAGGSAVG